MGIGPVEPDERRPAGGNKKKHYHGHRSRLRESLLKNAGGLADYQILELLLAGVLSRQDTKPLAKDLLARFETIRGVFTAERAELRKVPGFGPAMEAYWALLMEWRIRFDESPLKKRLVLSNPEDMAAMAISRLSGLAHEEMWLALLDAGMALIAWERLAKGTVNQAHFYSREIFALALEKKAVNLILAHNHPTGLTHPSRADLENTRTVANAANMLGMKLLDHIIVSGKDYFSFRANGLISG